MFDLKKINIEIFRAIRDDEKMIDLLEIDKSVMDNDTFISALRKQVLDTQKPDNLLNDYSTRLCIHDTPGGSANDREEVGYVAIDIHITQDKTAIDRRHLVIIKRLIEILDTTNRKKEGLTKLNIGLYGLSYRRRNQEQISNSTGWEKHTVVFEYKYLI